jgi:xanthine dehydrogenase YagR molybdenum-binding subunit
VLAGQDAVVQSARFDTFTEPVSLAARSLYAAPNRLTRHRLAKLDLSRSDSMRAPGDAMIIHPLFSPPRR